MVRVVLFALSFSLLATAAATQQQTEREITESQRRLEQIRRERERLREEMERVRGRVHDLSGEVRNLERQVSTSASLLSELEHQLTQRETSIEQNTQDLLATRTHLVDRRAILHRRLRDIYKRGPLHTAEALLTAESFADLINRYKYLFLIARRDRVLVEEVGALEQQLVTRERALRREVSMMRGLHEERAAEHRELASLRTQQQRALSAYRSRERTTATRIEQLEADEKRLTTLLATLERRRREAEAAAARVPGAVEPMEATLTTADLGRLAWPVEGRLLYRFGRAQQPNGTSIRWNGIGIAAAAGTSVRSVEAGSVVMAGPFEGYGPTVVLSHGGGYYSLYLYMETIRVKEGDTVTRGETLGTVGGRDTAEGPHLEFQIRAPGGQAVDPLGWLRKQGG